MLPASTSRSRLDSDILVEQLFLPNTPQSTKMPYLSKEEIEFAISRMPPVARDSNKINPRSLAKRVLKTPNMLVHSPHLSTDKVADATQLYFDRVFNILLHD